MASNPPILVTKPFLPPLEDFVPYLEKIWSSGILTNNGPLHQQLEREVSDYLGVAETAIFNNGTIALVTAVQAMKLSGEVITTPYSFVATAHAIDWAKLTPVFVDIDATSLNIDPNRIEAAITPNTSAILAVHCYGNPCDVETIETIAKRHNLKVIYDAAHAFGVTYKGKSLLRHGDLSILSFHATKVFNTFEGGAIIAPSAEMKAHLSQLRNFGIIDETTVSHNGLNGKMSEVHAAMGLLQLRHIESALTARRAIDQQYREAIADIPGIDCLTYNPHSTPNHSYFPVLVKKDYPLSRDDLYEALKRAEIFSRRYFYPLISNMDTYRHMPSADRARLPVANRIADQVLCLPIHPGLSEDDVSRVLTVLAGSGNLS